MADQLSLPLGFDLLTAQSYLTERIHIEERQDELRESLRQLKEEFADTLPLRTLETAIKVIRARRKLAAHPKEPCSLIEQAVVEGFVETFLIEREAEQEATQREAERIARGPVPDMTGSRQGG